MDIDFLERLGETIQSALQHAGAEVERSSKGSAATGACGETPATALRIDGPPGKLTCRSATQAITLSRWWQDCDQGVDSACATALGFAQGSLGNSKQDQGCPTF